MQHKINPEILLKHENEWVALKPDRSAVIASAKTLLKLQQKLSKLKKEGLIITHVLPFDLGYAP